jgi:hypothetical protein
VAGSCECGNEPSGSINGGGDFLPFFTDSNVKQTINEIHNFLRPTDRYLQLSFSTRIRDEVTCQFCE